MITTLETYYRDFLKVEITYPERKKPEVRYFVNKQQADIVLYALYRNYIYKKLGAYLKQRTWCLQHEPARLKEIAQLLVLFGMFEKATLGNICKFVHRHWEQFTDVAPGKKSRYHKHYISRIIPILNFCDEIGGAK